ncbi:hypothetical protein BWQ96_07245 [Gracilariopsis chorda]|uniref:Uncharacterized protein n=1 Tax=Gracilariopsis chorda TaxID=448386 RepID=A0A2V3ILS3_9FLOR|nr:hypothetical protein BWQ96_07245 [Gracilariopsis chorda]|eukprot:PXF42997.1 hypothetical protein BWQ96_07245 [Gracilariopsis chorda]
MWKVLASSPLQFSIDHEVFAWGNNTCDQLGNDGNGKSDMPVKVIINTTARVACFSCAHFHCSICMEVPETSSTPAMLSTTRFENASAIDTTKDADTVDESQRLVEEARERLAALLETYMERQKDCRVTIEALRMNENLEHDDISAALPF